MIDLAIDAKGRDRAARWARERGIRIPTFAQMFDPGRIPASARERLRSVGLWDLDPANLFRIGWRNEPVARGGFGEVNRLEFPPALTGTEARIVGLIGRWFPTGSHKVGATFGCLVPRLVAGQFDPARQKAVWPSTGNFCRGGAYVSALLGCQSIAVLPEGMSRERFEWLAKMAGEVIATRGSESNVKEIFDKTWELRRTRQDVVVFNQFEEFGNYLWHYGVTGRALEEAAEAARRPGQDVRGLVLTTGSAGTLASGDYLKQRFPGIRIAAGEAAQCPTLLENGFGEHRIEGIGDKHVPWIHDVRNTDMLIGVDDEAVTRLARLFNEPAGWAELVRGGVPPEFVRGLDRVGFSGIANLIMAVKFAKYWELGPDDLVLTVLTDSMDLYGSRLAEMSQRSGEYTSSDAVADRARWLSGLATDNVQELRHPDRRRVHNLKYFTWVEQQGKTSGELQAQWRDNSYWTKTQAQMEAIDTLIQEFNARAGCGD
jgi:cysteine synthase